MPVTVQLGSAFFEWLQGHRDPHTEVRHIHQGGWKKYDESSCTGSGPACRRYAIEAYREKEYIHRRPCFFFFFFFCSDAYNNKSQMSHKSGHAYF